MNETQKLIAENSAPMMQIANKVLDLIHEQVAEAAGIVAAKMLADQGLSPDNVLHATRAYETANHLFTAAVLRHATNMNNHMNNHVTAASADLIRQHPII